MGEIVFIDACHNRGRGRCRLKNRICDLTVELTVLPGRNDIDAVTHLEKCGVVHGQLLIPKIW
jgi:hypothetical protein